jgi:hypothetical protein
VLCCGPGRGIIPIFSRGEHGWIIIGVGEREKANYGIKIITITQVKTKTNDVLTLQPPPPQSMCLPIPTLPFVKPVRSKRSDHHTLSQNQVKCPFSKRNQKESVVPSLLAR